MVLPPPSADAAPAGEAWLRRLLRLLHLSSGGALILLDAAQPAALRPLVRALIELDGDTRVCLDVGPLTALPEGSLVLLRLRLADAVWLNLNRPLFARLRLRVVLWSEPGVTPQLHELAPDFFDWISHIVVCPDLVPEFVATGLRVAPPFPGVVWRGPLDPEQAIAVVFPGAGCQRRTWSRRYADILAALRDADPGWLVWDGLPNTRACQRLRFASREVGRGDLRCIIVDPPMQPPGFWPIDTHQTEWEVAAHKLAEDPHDPAASRLAALSGLEPATLDGFVALRSQHLDALLRAVDDPGAELARMSRSTADAVDLATFRAPHHVLRAWVTQPDHAEFTRSISAAVGHALVRWHDVANDPDRPAPNALWSATSDELLIWSASPRLAAIPLAQAPIPSPEGALALEAVLSPENAPRDDESLGRLVRWLHAYGHFDAALLWSTHGHVSEQMLAELHRMTAFEAVPALSEHYPALHVHTDVGLRKLERLAVEIVDQTLAPGNDPEQRLADIWREDHGTLDEPHLRFASLCQELAERLTARGRHTESIRLTQRALANYIAILGPEHYDVGYATAQLSRSMMAVGRQEEALRHAQQALTILRDTTGDAHPATLGLTRQLGSQLLGRNEVEEAWTLTRNVLQGAIRESHASLAVGETFLFLGTVELARGRAKVAQNHFDHALQIAIARAGVTSEHSAICHKNIAVALWSRGRLEQALEHLRRARAIMEHLHGPGSSHARAVHQDLATLLAETGRFSEAATLLETALAHIKPEDASRLEIMASLAKFYGECGRLADAESILVAALALARGQASHSEALGHLTVNLAALYSRTGRGDAGLELLQRYLDDPASDPDHAAFSAISLARGLAARGQYTRALELATRGLEREHSALVATQDLPSLREEMAAWEASRER